MQEKTYSENRPGKIISKYIKFVCALYLFGPVL